MKFEIRPSLIAKIALAIMFLALAFCFFCGCSKPEKQVVKSSMDDSLRRVVSNINQKIDSLNYEKSKIPYSRTDSAREQFWK